MPERSPSAQRPGAALAAGVLYPFVLTRAGLLLVAWFATQFSPRWTYLAAGAPPRSPASCSG